MRRLNAAPAPLSERLEPYIEAAIVIGLTAALFTVAAWAVWPPSPDPDRHYAFLAKYKDGYAVTLNLDGVNFDQACITSSDYMAFDLDPRVRCKDCKATDYYRSLSGELYRDHIVYLRHGDTVDIRKIYNMEAGYMGEAFLFGAPESEPLMAQYGFRYGFSRRAWEKLSAQGLEQCTTSPLATAKCYPLAIRCVFLFDSRVTEDD